MILEAKTSPPLVSSHYPKLILRGKVYLSPPPLHWVVAPAFNICSDYSRSRNLMLSPRVGIKILTFFIFHFRPFLGRIFILRRFSLEVLSILKCVKWRVLENIYKTQWNVDVFLGCWCKFMFEHPKLQGEAHFSSGCDAFAATLTDVWWNLHIICLYEF